MQNCAVIVAALIAAVLVVQTQTDWLDTATRAASHVPPERQQAP